MYSKFQLSLKFYAYYFTALNGKGHGIHSPFIFNFINHVLIDKRIFYAYQQIEKERQTLLKNFTQLNITDFGAGSRVLKQTGRSVSAIAKSSLKQKKFGQLLFRMVNYYKPVNILEIGTSLGISTSYLAYANTQSKVITLEGSDAIAKEARKIFETLHLKNIELIEGNFADTLQPVLQSLQTIDLAFIDGNHSLQPTIDYFLQILNKSNNNTIIIADDIHWSKEMEQAWHFIKQHEAVTATIDLFSLGIIFLRKEFAQKQHFTIRF